MSQINPFSLKSFLSGHFFVTVMENDTCVKSNAISYFVGTEKPHGSPLEAADQLVPWVCVADCSIAPPAPGCSTLRHRIQQTNHWKTHRRRWSKFWLVLDTHWKMRPFTVGELADITAACTLLWLCKQFLASSLWRAFFNTSCCAGSLSAWECLQRGETMWDVGPAWC